MNKYVNKLIGAIFMISFLLIASGNIQANAADSSEIENNDVRSNATALNDGNVVVGKADNYSDIDWYEITVPYTGYFTVSFGKNSMDTTDVSNGWNLEIYDGSTCIYSTAVGIDNITTPKFMYEKDKKLFVKITPITHDWSDSYADNIEYSILVNSKTASEWECEYDDVKSDANKINLDSSYYGNAWSNTDSDWYRVKLDKTGYFTLDFSKASIDTEDVSYGWNVFIYAEDKCIYSTNVALDNFTSPEFPYKKDTNVYVKVIPDTRDWSDSYAAYIDYKLQINLKATNSYEKEDNDTKSLANTIAEGKGKGLVGNIYNIDDIDYYKYTASKTGNIKLYFGNENSDIEDVSYGWNVAVSINGKEKFNSELTNNYKKVSSLKVKKGDKIYIKINAGRRSWSDSYAANINYKLQLLY